MKIIRSLRCANYSLSSILRMLNTLSRNPEADIRQVIDTPKENDSIISVCDKLLNDLLGILLELNNQIHEEMA